MGIGFNFAAIFNNFCIPHYTCAIILHTNGPNIAAVLTHQETGLSIGKSSESVQCAISDPCLCMRHRPSP